MALTFQIIVHKGYNKRNKANDIALLKIEPTIDFQAKPQIGCVCEPQPLEEVVTEKCVALGWGRTSDDKGWSENLRQVTLPILPNDKCGLMVTNNEGQVCAGGIGGHDTCTGDSGGPLVCPLKSENGSYTLVGLTSFGPVDCGQADSPAIYTNVRKFVDWIKKHSGEEV